MTKSERLQAVIDFLQRQKVGTLDQLIEVIGCNERTVQRYIKQLNGITSYTHSGRYITLSSIPKFNSDGIWFYRTIGFTKFSSSIELIVRVINSNSAGMTRQEIQRILKVQIFQQICVLLKSDRIHRIKIGNKYIYIPEEAVNNKKKTLKIVGSLQSEEYYYKGLNVSDLISVLKIVLQEANIDIKSLKKWIKKYPLKISVNKLEQIIQKFKLDEKKTLLP